MAPADRGPIDLLERGFADFSSGDWDAAIETMHPDVEWHAAFVLPDLASEVEALAAAGADPTP